MTLARTTVCRTSCNVTTAHGVLSLPSLPQSRGAVVMVLHTTSTSTLTLKWRIRTSHERTPMTGPSIVMIVSIRTASPRLAEERGEISLYKLVLALQHTFDLASATFNALYARAVGEGRLHLARRERPSLVILRQLSPPFAVICSLSAKHLPKDTEWTNILPCQRC